MEKILIRFLFLLKFRMVCRARIAWRSLAFVFSTLESARRRGFFTIQINMNQATRRTSDHIIGLSGLYTVIDIHVVRLYYKTLLQR